MDLEKGLGDSMFLLFLLFLDIGLTYTSVYLYYYRIDGMINNAYIIILSIVVSLLITAFIAWLLIELLYLLLPSDKIQKSLFTHRLLKQIVSVPLHLKRLRIKVIGKEYLPKDTGFTIYSNHNSWDDPIIIAYGLYNYIIAALGKEGAFNLPVVGKLAPKFGSVMIHRNDPRQSAKAIKQVIKHVNEGLGMIIFPEGTRSKDLHSLLDFKAGAFKVALRSGKPLVPITLIKDTKKKLFHTVIIKIHKPLLFEDFKDLKSNVIAAQVKEIINNSL